MLVGKQELDGLEAGLGGRLEAIEKRHLVEHEGEIGGKARHGVPQGQFVSSRFIMCVMARSLNCSMRSTT